MKRVGRLRRVECAEPEGRGSIAIAPGPPTSSQLSGATVLVMTSINLSPEMRKPSIGITRVSNRISVSSGVVIINTS